VVLVALLGHARVAAGDERAAAPGAASAQASPAERSDAPVGEPPSSRTADETVLRDAGALLPRARQTLELGLSYSRAERDLGVAAVAQSVAEAELTWRVGIWRELQVSARLPFRLRRTTVTGELTRAAETHARLGDVTVGAVGVALHEAPGRPNVVWTLEAVVPTGPGDAGLGAGVAVTRSYDPVIVFAGLSYVHGLRVRPESLDRVLARNNVGANAGFAFAVNESVALTVQTVASLRSHTTTASGARAPPERYLVRLGLTWLVGRALFVEPLVAFAVGGPAPDVTFGINLPWTF